MGLVTVARYCLPHNADLARSALEGHGIPVYLCDEFLSTLDVRYSLAIGGIKLQVEEQDVGRAVEILGIEPPAQTDASTESPPPVCPRCRSQNTRRILRPIVVTFFATFGFLVPHVPPARRYRCLQCKTKWRA